MTVNTNRNETGGRCGKQVTRTRCPVCGETLPDVEPFMDVDREYFEKHPRAASYDRASFHDEHPYCDAPYIVTVTQVEPGIRMREARRLQFFATGAAPVEA